MISLLSIDPRPAYPERWMSCLDLSSQKVARRFKLNPMINIKVFEGKVIREMNGYLYKLYITFSFLKCIPNNNNNTIVN